jgi:hypothetical protein
LIARASINSESAFCRSVAVAGLYRSVKPARQLRLNYKQ